MKGFPPKDEWGMSAEDRRFLAWELDQEERRHRFKALKALWGHRGPKVWYSGCEGNSAGKGDDWTFWRAVRMSLALIFGRQWGQVDEDAYERQTGRRFCKSFNMCFWDNGPTYGGYTVMVGRLCPGLRCEIFHDGETFL